MTDMLMQKCQIALVMVTHGGPNDGTIKRWRDGWMDGWVGGWMDIRKDA